MANAPQCSQCQISAKWVLVQTKSNLFFANRSLSLSLSLSSPPSKNPEYSLCFLLLLNQFTSGWFIQILSSARAPLCSIRSARRRTGSPATLSWHSTSMCFAMAGHPRRPYPATCSAASVAACGHSSDEHFQAEAGDERERLEAWDRMIFLFRRWI
jgi:hypothetical protein